MSDERLELEQIPSPEGQLVRAGYPRAGYGDSSVYGYGYGYGDDERAYLRRMWHVIRKRKLVIAVIAVLVTSVITVEVFRSKSIYQAATTIEVGKERTMMRSGDVVIQTDEMDDTYLVSLGMKTKMRLLQSRPLLEDVVVNLKLDQNPKFLDVTTKKSIWEAMQSIMSKFRPPDANVNTPPAVGVSASLPATKSGM